VANDGATPEVVVEALGVAVGIPVTGAAAARLRRQWSRAVTDRAAETVVDLRGLNADDDVLHDYAITSLVTMAALDATAGTRINLHAGAVADERGRALAVIGPSGSGKTTAISLLAGRLGYLTDETVSLDDDLRVHAHPKPLSVITDVDEPRHKQSLSPDDLDLARPPQRAHLHRIVVLHRGVGDAGLVPASIPRSIVEIVEQTSSLVRLEHPIHRLAATIDACGGVWALEYAEFADRLDDMVGLLDREPQPPAEHVHHPFTTGTDPVPGAWSRAAWTDAEEYGDELVLMVGDRVHLLAGLGVVVWLGLATPRTVDELVARAQDLWGDHPGASDLVADALAVLAEQGLLQPPA
jgi:hypothetical protein